MKTSRNYLHFCPRNPSYFQQLIIPWIQRYMPLIGGLLGCNSKSYGPSTMLSRWSRFMHICACAVYKGNTKVAIRIVDTEVVVIAVTAFKVLSPQELWVAFEIGSNFRFIAVQKIVDERGAENLPSCPSSMHLFGVTQCLYSVEEGRRQPGMYGLYILRPQRLSMSWVPLTTSTKKACQLLRDSSYWYII